MKDLIVLVAVIVLGIFIGGIVLGLKDKATLLGQKGSSAIDTFTRGL